MSWYWCWKCRRAWQPPTVQILVPAGHRPEPRPWDLNCPARCMGREFYSGAEMPVKGMKVDPQYHDLLEAAHRVGGFDATKEVIDHFYA